MTPDDSTQGPSKPQWLQRLEEESWQAELIVSGIAIFGSLQLPGLLSRAVNWALGTFSAPYLEILSFLFIYLSCAVQALIICFVLHFLVRTIWIGNIGLLSVFPRGIRKGYEKFSAAYEEGLHKEFPDFQGFNQRLDRLGSLLFSIAGLWTIIFVTINIGIVIASFLGFLLTLAFPGLSVTQFLLALAALLFPFLMLPSLLSLPWLRERPWVRRYHFPLYRVASKVMFGPFYRQVNYSSLTLITNSKSQNYLGVLLLSMVVLIGSAMVWMLGSNYFYLKGDIRNRLSGRAVQMLPAQYDDKRAEGNTYIPFASIPSDVIREPVLPVYIPLTGIEQAYLKPFCGEKWEGGRESRLLCVEAYYRFEFNAQGPVAPTGAYFFSGPGQPEDGVRFYLSTGGLEPGGNILSIVPARPETDSFVVRIPFQFFPEQN